ncbi:MAG TPA: hypothetical protein VK858_01220 [Longimicrobiales bacterium]|nr:hypothetical protein [Longimicrobiales bacterium]
MDLAGPSATTEPTTGAYDIVRDKRTRTASLRATLLRHVGLALLVLGAASPLTGQEDDGGSLSCFTIRALPECRGYLVVEVQGVFPVASTSQGYAGVVGTPPQSRRVFRDSNLEFNLGYMVNATSALSLGGALTLGSGSGGVPDGARARARWWMHPRLSVELEAGVHRTNLGSFVGSPLTGPSVAGRLNVRDLGAVFLRYDRVDVPADGRWAGGPASAVSVGAGASSGAALVSGALIGLAVIGLVLIAPGS